MWSGSYSDTPGDIGPDEWENATSTEVIIIRAVQTCGACPSQWDAWDQDGHYWYLRYRHGIGTAERQPSPDLSTWTDLPPALRFEHGDRYDGSISLSEFCARAGLNLALAGK